MKTIHRIIHALIATLGCVAITGAVAWAEETAAPPPGERQPDPADRLGPANLDAGRLSWCCSSLLGEIRVQTHREALDRRGETIKKSIDDAEKQRAEAKKLMEDYQKQLAEARNEAGQDHRGSPPTRRTRPQGSRRQSPMPRPRRRPARPGRNPAAEGKRHSGDEGHRGRLSVQIASRVIEKEVNEATHRQLVENLIKDLSKIQRA